MNSQLVTIDEMNLSTLEAITKKNALNSLESGKVIYFPNYFFQLNTNEQALLSEGILDPKHKNISYDLSKRRIKGVSPTIAALGINTETVEQFMHRYAHFAKELVIELLPHYRDALQIGRTSFRTAEIEGRKTSKRKNDTRVHVDSFAATPVHGLRILRVFCNINPENKPRVWHLGEPFSELLKKFAPKIPRYNPWYAKSLKWLKVTKTLRTAYDHYMLHLHDQMKLDDDYQTTLHKFRMEFPSKSSWIVFTDQTSHAALSGQFLLEQTFYLPVSAMENPELSPLKQWERDVDEVLI